MQLHPEASLDGPTLEARRVAKRQEVLGAKNTALSSMMFSQGGRDYEVCISGQDQIDVQNRIEQLSAAPFGTIILWELVDFVFFYYTLDDFKRLRDATMQHVDAVFANASELISAVNSSDTPEKIDTRLGWPA